MINILHVDDHKMFVQGLKLWMDTYMSDKLKVVDVCYSGEPVVNKIILNDIDLILLDLNIPEIDGLRLIPELRFRFSKLRIVVLSEYSDPKFVRRALKSGADGYILKSRSYDILIRAMEDVMAGEVYIDPDLSVVSTPDRSAVKDRFEDGFILRHSLTPREVEILSLISEAKTNKDIGEQLYISDQTVSVHRKNLMRKLNVSNTASLIRKALEYHLLVGDGELKPNK